VDKFRDNAARAVPAPALNRIESLAAALDTLADVGTLMKALRA
jgi:hypothetical protein